MPPTGDIAKSSIVSRLMRLFTKGVSSAAPLPGEKSSNFWKEWHEAFGVANDRRSAYLDYFLMERESPVIAAALDALADASTSSAEGESTDIYSVVFEDETHEESIGRVFGDLEDRTAIKDRTWQIIRGFAHLGDEFAEIVIDKEDMSIARIKALPAESMVVVPQDLDNVNMPDAAYQQYDQNGQPIADFKVWEIIHWGHRVRTTDLYGRSMLFSLRRIFRQLQMIEDAMVLNRLKRATMRYVHKVPVGNKSPEEALRIVRLYEAQNRRIRRIDPVTGRVIYSQWPLTEETDFYVPVGEKAAGDVTSIQGQSALDRIADVEYFMNQLFAGLRTPKAFLGFEKDTRDKNTITTIDIAFARHVRKAQSAHGAGIRQIYDTELVLRGIDPASVRYRYVYPPIGTIDDMRKWQVELLKSQVATALKTGQLIEDEDYLLRRILEVEEEEIERIKKANAEKAQEREDKQAEMMAMGGGLPPKPGAAGAPAPKLPNLAPKFEHLRRARAPRSLARAVDSLLYQGSPLRGELREVLGFAKPITVRPAPSSAPSRLAAANGRVLADAN